MSLLDDVSIVVTPNGYKAGELYAVIPVPTEGADKVTDGDFPLPNVNWTLGGGTSITVDGAKIDNTVITGNAYVFQGISGTVFGRQFILTYDVIATNGKDLRLDQGTAYTLDTSTTGTNRKFYFTWDRVDSFLNIKRIVADTDVTIDNVILQEYTAADMDVTRATDATRVDEDGLVNYAEIIGGEEVTNGDFESGTTGWNASYSGTLNNTGNALNVVAVGANDTRASTPITTVIGEYYRFVSDITQIQSTVTALAVSNTTNLDSAFVNGSNITTPTNSVTVFFTATATTTYIGFKRGGGSADGITNIYDNVSVKEVTRDNVPRIDYTGGGCPHILAEPQRTNTLTYSEDFSQWATSGTTPTLTTGQLSPSGESNATKISGTIGSSLIYLATASSSTATRSIYARTVSGTGTARLMSYYTNSNNLFTLTEEWQRFELTGTVVNSANYYIDFRDSSQTLSEFIIWGAQSEEATYATSYIPTSGSTVTRNQDIFTRDGISSLINSPEGVLFAEIAALSDDGTSRDISVSDGTSANYARISLSNAVGNIEYNVVVGSSTQASGTSAITQTNFNKIAVKWKVNDFALWVNGSEVLTDLSGTSFSASTLTTLNFDRGSGTNDFYGKVRQLQVYDTALDDTQLAALTT